MGVGSVRVERGGVGLGGLKMLAPRLLLPSRKTLPNESESGAAWRGRTGSPHVLLYSRVYHQRALVCASERRRSSEGAL